MGTQFANGNKAISECDRCGFRFKLKELRKLFIKETLVNIKVCKECWEPSQPQLRLGEYPVYDPQALREPRPDLSYITSGVNNEGEVSGGSRIIQWGWAPVGFGNGGDYGLTPNNLVAVGSVGTVTVTTS